MQLCVYSKNNQTIQVCSFFPDDLFGCKCRQKENYDTSTAKECPKNSSAFVCKYFNYSHGIDNIKCLLFLANSLKFMFTEPNSDFQNLPGSHFSFVTYLYTCTITIKENIKIELQDFVGSLDVYTKWPAHIY